MINDDIEAILEDIGKQSPLNNFSQFLVPTNLQKITIFHNFRYFIYSIDLFFRFVVKSCVPGTTRISEF